jgi:hypothetical protein
VLRGNGAHLLLRHEVDARRVPRWGAGAVDSLDSRRGAASRLALVAPPPPPSAGEATGQTRMLLFRHVGKTSSIPPPVGGLSAAIVAIVRRGKEYHVIAVVEGHELKTPETEHRPGLERLLETTHLELDGKLFVNMQQAPTWHANCRRFDPGGSLDRRVNCRRVPQPRWVGARRRLLRGRGRVCLPWSRSSPSPGVGRGGVRRLPGPSPSPSPRVGRGGASYGARGRTWPLSASLCRVAQQSE